MHSNLGRVAATRLPHVFTRSLLLLGASAIALFAQPCATSGPPCVLTSQYNNSRDAYNPDETVLTSFKLASGTTLTELSPLLVDTPPAAYGLANPIYAQPLYVAGISLSANAPEASQENCSNLTVSGHPGCNMVLAVTLYDSIWAYNADTGKVIFSRTGLWSDCGTGASVPVAGQGGVGSLPFGGIISTPVIDTTLSPPAMFLTDLCLDSQAKAHWFLHEVDITNQLQDVTGSSSPVEITGSNAGAGFVAGTVMQRPALLEVQNPGGTPANAIYIAFGAAVSEAGPNPYHGWLFGYSTTGPNNQLVQDFVFNASGAASDTAIPSCNTNAPLCGESCKSGQYENQPNWCGHGGGIWLSGRGPAASTATGVTRAFVGVGNGGFQSGAANWGNSIVDFTSSATTGVGGTPADSFTPRGGPNSPFSTAILSKTDCPATEGGTPALCDYTVEDLNENDMDMSVSGIMVFEDQADNFWLMTADKTGAGYLLNQENLGGFNTNDTGNQFPFVAAATPCWALNTQSSGCHRVTSFATLPANAANPRRIFYWPFQEDLTSVQFSENTTTAGIGTIVTTGSAAPYTTVALSSACTLNSTSTPCLNNQMVAGATLTVGGSAQTVISVGKTGLTVTPGFAAPVNTSAWTYHGYLIKPVYASQASQFPGGQLMVTSNNGTGGIVWGLATIETAAAPTPAKSCATLTAMINAYDPITLGEIWSSYSKKNTGQCDGPCFSITPPPVAGTCTPPASTYGLPVVVNGSIYIPTYQITSSDSNPSCTSSTPCSGMMVYCGSGTTACNGEWQALKE